MGIKIKYGDFAVDITLTNQLFLYMIGQEHLLKDVNLSSDTINVYLVNSNFSFNWGGHTNINSISTYIASDADPVLLEAVEADTDTQSVIYRLSRARWSGVYTDVIGAVVEDKTLDILLGYAPFNEIISTNKDQGINLYLALII